jgi:putative transposase
LVGGNFNYLSLITDAYSKLIVGYCLHPTLEAAGSLIALEMAILTRRKSTVLIHHSDRGVQYCCNDYVKLLSTNKILISMTNKGDPYENAIAERVNGILKNEFNLNKSHENRDIALNQVKESIKLYNEKRPHLSNNFLTPIKAHQQTGILEKKWKPKIYKKSEVRF